MNGRVLCLAILCSRALPGCDSHPLPGTALGTYSIQAAIHANTCGTQLGAPDPWAFDAEVSRDGEALYWRQNGQILTGAIDGNARATIASSQAAQTGSNPRCSMTRTDTLALALGPEATPVIRGGLTFAFTAPPADCSGLLAGNGGPYAALPCQIEYTLTATRSQAP